MLIVGSAQPPVNYSLKNGGTFKYSDSKEVRMKSMNRLSRLAARVTGATEFLTGWSRSNAFRGSRSCPEKPDLPEGGRGGAATYRSFDECASGILRLRFERAWRIVIEAYP